MKYPIIKGFALAALLLAGAAVAQTVSIPKVSSVSTGDLVRVMPQGQVRVGDTYADVATLKTYMQSGGTAGAVSATTVTATSSIKSTGAAAGIGYGTGAGCAVTQATSRTTGVTCTGETGAITLVSAAGSATPASFTVTNTSIAATDNIIVNEQSGTDLYEIFVTNIGAGSFKITSFTTGGTTTEQPVFNFSVIKGSAN